MKKRGPVCDCPTCYSLWAKEEIERLQEVIADRTNDVSHYNNELDFTIKYAAFLRSVIRSGETLPDSYDQSRFRREMEAAKEG